ncbi:MAG: DUF4384 domain-containing protein [Planctomycetes bacterium]|nr:DUF4384 domain-containing protein [Planctomycetota bacterium]MCB9871247.1 DUF4384 domain-containing protein [Planctomycetota bacterium]
MTRSTHSLFVRSALVAAPFLLVGCQALAAAAVTVGSSLLTTVASNYNPTYGNEVKNLLATLKHDLKLPSLNPALTGGTPAGPIAAGDPPPTAPTGGEPPAKAAEEPPPAEPPGTKPVAAVPTEAPTAGATPAPVAATGPTTPATPIALEVALLRQQDVAGEVKSVPIQDGEVLVDTRADGSSDRFKVYFKTDRPAFVYVILVDGTGWVQPLFPSAASSATNPVQPGSETLLPEGELAFALDSYKGVETLYFVASDTRRPDLETMLQSFAARTRTPPATAKPVAEPAVVEQGIARTTRGAPGSLRTRSGVQPFETTRFLSDLRKGGLVITRWFRHQ